MIDTNLFHHIVAGWNYDSRHVLTHCWCYVYASAYIWSFACPTPYNVVTTWMDYAKWCPVGIVFTWKCTTCREYAYRYRIACKHMHTSSNSSRWCIVPGWRTEWSLTLYIKILFSVWSVPYYCEINMTYICCIGVDTFQHIWLKYLIKTQHQSPNCSWSASYKVKISYQHFALI